jgi:hypothetical protein
LKRAYGYAEEAGMARGKKRRENPAMTTESDGVFIAELLILPLQFWGAIGSIARTLQVGSNDSKILFTVISERK